MQKSLEPGRMIMIMTMTVAMWVVVVVVVSTMLVRVAQRVS
ncbi:hypothetical protein [Microbacterium azadirachtae]|nr:hypothetical protein [Microbacterium azadirachtae]